MCVPYTWMAKLLRTGSILQLVKLRDVCHGENALRYLSLSYAKKDWRVGPFFGYDTNYKTVFCCPHRLYSVVGVIPKKEGPTNLSFGMTMIRLRHVFP